MEAGSPVQQQEVQLYEGDFLELEAKGQDAAFPDVSPPLSERESDLKKELEALQKILKKQGEKTKRLKAKNKKLKEQVAAKKEVAISDHWIPYLMYIDVRTPEHVWKARRSHAENFKENCGTCSRREAGEYVSPLLIQEVTTHAQEISTRGRSSQRACRPTRGCLQRGSSFQKRSFRERFNWTVTSVWDKQIMPLSMIELKFLPCQCRDKVVGVTDVGMASSIMFGLFSVPYWTGLANLSSKYIELQQLWTSVSWVFFLGFKYVSMPCYHRVFYEVF